MRWNILSVTGLFTLKSHINGHKPNKGESRSGTHSDWVVRSFGISMIFIKVGQSCFLTSLWEVYQLSKPSQHSGDYSNLYKMSGWMNKDACQLDPAAGDFYFSCQVGKIVTAPWAGCCPPYFLTPVSPQALCSSLHAWWLSSYTLEAGGGPCWEYLPPRQKAA